MSDGTPLTLDALQIFAQELCTICFEILARAGPFLKENIYQELLIHELELLGYKTIREFVFNFNFMDSLGNNVIIGNNHSMRSDIEIPTMSTIIELKASPTPTKHEHLWQLRNYLNHRKLPFGVLVNFVSKFDSKSSPHVQCDLIFHENDKFYLKSLKSKSIAGFDEHFIESD